MDQAKKILLIDDEPGIRNLIADYLKHEHYQVFTAPDGDMGLSIIERERPQLVFLDLNLVKCSGLDVLKRIKNQFPDTVVIMLSGGHDEEKAKEAIAMGAYDYLTKPITLKSLLHDVIEKVFAE